MTKQTQNEVTIFPEDKEAAYMGTVTGWISRNGYFYGNNEHAARWDGSTHRICKCGNIYKKNSYCEPCSDIQSSDRYHAMKEEDLGPEDIYVSYAYDRYFRNIEELLDFIHDEEIKDVTELMLQPGKPNKAFAPDPTELYEDIFPEENDDYNVIPKEVIDAFDELHEKLTKINAIISYEPKNTKLSKKCVEEIQKLVDKV